MTVWGFSSRAIAEALKRLVGGTPQPSPTTRGQHVSMWLFKTPAGGIPAMVGVVPGKAKCPAWYPPDVEDEEIEDVELEEMLDDDGEQLEIYCYSYAPRAIAGDVWVIALSHFGKPVATVNFCP